MFSFSMISSWIVEQNGFFPFPGACFTYFMRNIEVFNMPDSIEVVVMCFCLFVLFNVLVYDTKKYYSWRRISCLYYVTWCFVICFVFFPNT